MNLCSTLTTFQKDIFLAWLKAWWLIRRSTCFFFLYQSHVGWLMRLIGFICKELVGSYLSSLWAKLSNVIYCWNLQNLQYSVFHSDDCEIACFDITQRGVFKENFPKSPTLERPNHFCAVACEKVCQLKVINSYKLTFAVSVGTSEDGAFLDAAEGLEKAPHIIFWLLLVEHADKELSVF